MSALLNNKHLVNKMTELVKFIVSAGLLYFMFLKTPDQAGNLISYAGAFVLGGSKVREKLGL